MISLIIPTYNEKENVLELIRRAKEAFLRAGEAEYEILVMDDDSPDGTWRVVSELKDLRVRSVNRRGRPRGLSAAVIDGFAEAKGDILGVMDADLSHPPEVLPSLISAIRSGCSVAVGSRYVRGGGIRDWPAHRVFASRLACALARPLTPVKDSTSGFFFVQKKALENVTLNPLGFKIGLEVFVKAKHDGKIREAPYVFTDRRAGSSKLKLPVIGCYLKQVCILLKIKKILAAAGFAGILLLAFGMRAHTFFMPHWEGEEGRYVSLAMKYDALGLDAMDLSRVEFRPSVFAGFPGWQFMVVALEKNKNSGSVDPAPGTDAPLFPVMLAASHRWLAPGQPFVVAQSKPEGSGREMLFKKYFLRTQGWAVAVPLLSGLFTVALVFFFVLRLWGMPAAFCAMAVSAVYPGWVAASAQITPGALMVFLTIAAFYIFYLSCEENGLLLAFASGILAGLAAMAGQNLLFLTLPGALHVLLRRGKPRIFFWFLCGTVFISAHWFLRIWR